MRSYIITEASEKLKQEISEELLVEDPETLEAEAAINASKTDRQRDDRPVRNTVETL